jgi:RNA polymerase sigma-70 factor (ECF subfamily)
LIVLDEEIYAIIRQARQGSKEAFTHLMKRYKAHVFRFANGMLGDRLEAEDVSQEVFIKVYYSLSRLENEYAFGSWLIRIVSNLCYDRLKKKKLLSVEFIDPVLENSSDQHQLRLSIEEALQKLSPEHREVILLKEIQGFSYEEIASALEIPLGTVKSRINAARLGLRNELNR